MPPEPTEPRPRRRRRLLLGLFLAFPTVLVFLGLAALWVARGFDAPGPLAEERTVEIARGSGLNAIAQQLDQAGVVEPYWLFALGVRATGKARMLRAGEFLFPAGVSMRDAMEILASGQVVQYALTLPEGLTSQQAVALIAEAEALQGELAEVPAEGSLLPETYAYVPQR